MSCSRSPAWTPRRTASSAVIPPAEVLERVGRRHPRWRAPRVRGAGHGRACRARSGGRNAPRRPGDGPRRPGAGPPTTPRRDSSSSLSPTGGGVPSKTSSRASAWMVAARPYPIARGTDGEPGLRAPRVGGQVVRELGDEQDGARPPGRVDPATRRSPGVVRCLAIADRRASRAPAPAAASRTSRPPRRARSPRTPGAEEHEEGVEERGLAPPLAPRR